MKYCYSGSCYNQGWQKDGTWFDYCNDDYTICSKCPGCPQKYINDDGTYSFYPHE